MRCPACGARNTEAAAWCTQCYADLRAPGPPAVEDAPPAVEDAPPAAGEPPATTEDAPPAAADAPPADAATRDVRTVAGEVEWRCAVCGGWSPLVRERCATCGSPRQGFGEAAPPPALGGEARGRLAAASVLFPGLGHLLARRIGTGAARLVLAASWLAGALVVLVGADGAAALPAVPLLLGAAVLWIGSVRDVLALVDGRPELLRPRVLSWLAGGVLAGLVVLTVVVGGRAGPAG